MPTSASAERRRRPASTPPCTMPNSACPGAARAAKATRARSAQRSDSSMARSASLRSAGNSMHSSSCIWMSAPSRHWISTARSGVSMWRLPSMCEAKRTPSSLISRILESDITWKPPRVGEDRPVPAHEGVQAAEAGDAFRAGAQHQVIGVGEHDVGAGRLHLVEVQRLDGGGGADRHERRRADDPVRRRHRAAARGTVLRQELEPKPRHAFLHSLRSSRHPRRLSRGPSPPLVSGRHGAGQPSTSRSSAR